MSLDAMKKECTLMFFRIIQEPYSEINNEILMSLLRAGIDIDAQYGEDLSPKPQPELIENIIDDNPEMAELIRERVKNPYCQNSPLHYAVVQNYSEILEELLRQGANPNSQNSEGDTPLHWAVISRRQRAIDRLLNHDAKIGILNNGNKTPLWLMLFYIDHLFLEEGGLGYELFQNFLSAVINHIAMAGCFDELQEDFCETFLNEDLQDDWKNDWVKRKAIAKREEIHTPEKMSNKIVSYTKDEQYKIIKILERQFDNAMQLKTSEFAPGLLVRLLSNIHYDVEDVLEPASSTLLLSRKHARDEAEPTAALADDNDSEEDLTCESRYKSARHG